MTFAEILHEKNLKQAQLAESAGVSRQRINEWVKGARNPKLMSLAMARRVADSLNMTLDEFESRCNQ